MKARIFTTTLLVLLLFCISLVSIHNAPYVMGEENNDKKDYRDASMFYEDFERRIVDWKPKHEGRWENI
jgi:hypothetical protein